MTELRVGTLLSVNVGRPCDVEWQGGVVRTAIWKETVAGSRIVQKLNVAGDQQADLRAHGGEHRAVFVYQIQSYRYWEEQLGRNDFTYGQFGENFTVDGLADDEVCIGDRYRIGTAVFEVTQPRVTCYRLGIRMNEPAMPSLLVSHHRPGFYFRVITEGLVEAGDHIVRVALGPERLTVADIDGLLYLPRRSMPLLRRAVNIPALSTGWQDSFRALLDQDSEPASEPAWTGFRSLVVTSLTKESENIISVRLSPPDGSEPLPAVRPGQYLTLKLRPAGTDGAPALRNYSLSDTATENGYRISVKLEPGGVGSGYVHAGLAIGEVLEVAAPRGDFVLQTGDRPVVLISAGVGATPVLAMLHELAELQSSRAVWWIHSARNAAEHAFRREAETLLTQLPGAHRTVTYTRPQAGDQSDATGRLNVTGLPPGIPAEAEFYLCGPAGFMEAISAGLVARGVPAELIRTEAFGPSRGGSTAVPHAPAGPPGTLPDVTFVRSNLTVPWNDRFANLLEFAEACDVPTGFGCRHGVCHVCEAGLLGGTIEEVVTPLDPAPAGRVLLCCSRPVGEVVLEL